MENFDNFFLSVADLEKAKNFYQKSLGLSIKFVFSDKGMTVFQIPTGLAVEFEDPFGNRLGITDYSKKK